jgi:predicted DCC family thiol-disulfide oxidoreductase YuxK
MNTKEPSKKASQPLREGSPAVPSMLWDGDCGFCRRWIEKWRKVTGSRVRYEPYQEVIDRYPQLTRSQCRKAVQLVMTDGTVFSGAHAVFKALSLAGKRHGVPLWLYENIPLFDRMSEAFYQFVSRNRSFLSEK